MKSKRKSQSKRQTILFAIALVVLVGLVGFLYWTYFYEIDTGPDPFEKSQKGLLLNTKFPLDVLSDERITDLQQFGPERVEARDRGRNADPFLPF